MFTRIIACLLLTLISAQGLSGADFALKVTDKNYLDTQGFSVFLYDSTYHPVFVDQKNTAMEMILHGQRIATNGDVRLMPTPEHWDLVATLKDRNADKANNRLSADLAFPTFDFSYTLEVVAEPGGVKVSINLDKPLPQKLAGRAGFNLEFLPSIYMGKSYLVDGTKAGIFPRTPNDPMTKVLPLADEPKKAYYLEDWDRAKGYTQPLPFAEGKSITLGIDDALARVNVVSDTANLMLFDGRDRAPNGWFVLRSLIPSGMTTGAVVWHIRPDVIPNWTRPPVIAHSQVGYAPGFSKVAVLELDPKYNAPKTASLLSGLSLYNSLPAAAHLVQNDIRGSFPDEWLRFIVPLRQPLIDGPFEFLNTTEGAAADHSTCDKPKQTFRLVEPRTAGGSEVKLEAAPLFRFQPSLDDRTLMSGIVIHDEVNVLVRGQLFFQLVEKPDELASAMPELATANHFPVQNIESGK